MISSSKTLLVVCGPTAIGKTTMAIELSKHFACPIISADSRQVYKELNIGTAKPSKEELAQAKHYFINHISIQDDFSAGQYEAEAIDLLRDLFRQYNVVILSGGTGLYIQAICEGFDDIPSVEPAIRNELIKQYNEKGIEFLQQEVLKVDPSAYAQIDINNPQRLMRILEVFRGHGQKLSSLQLKKKKSRPFETIKIGLEMDRQQLYDRINLRVDDMIDRGLLEEVKQLQEHKDLNALQTVGYKEILQYFSGEITLDQAIELVKRNSRRYAKRQMTWLRRDEAIHWFAAGDLEGILGSLS